MSEEGKVDIDSVMTFGKYKGQTIRKLCVLNPGYLLWCHKNVHWFKLDKDSLRIAIAKDEQRSHERASTIKQQRRKIPASSFYGALEPDDDHDGYDDSPFMRADDWSPSSFF